MYLHPNKKSLVQYVFHKCWEYYSSLASLFPFALSLFLCFEFDPWKIIYPFSVSHWKPHTHPIPCLSEVTVSLWPGNAGPDPSYAPGGGWTSTAHNNATAVSEQPLSFPAEHTGGWVALTALNIDIFFFLWRAGGPNAVCIYNSLFPCRTQAVS